MKNNSKKIFEKTMCLAQLVMSLVVAVSAIVATVFLIADQGIHWHTLAFVAINIILCAIPLLIAKEYKDFVEEL